MFDGALQTRYIVGMKTTSLPSIRVEPEFRSTVESLLHSSETLTEFIDHAVREAVNRRSHQAAFVARGLQSLEAAAQSGDYVEASAVVDTLRQRLAAAKAGHAGA